MTPTGDGKPRHVWVDGAILPAEGPHLSVFDRGFQLGDGVFETLRARGGRTTELDAHLARLHRSADGLDISLPPDIDEQLTAGIAALLAADGLDGPDGDASIRVTVSRGAYRTRGRPAGRRGRPGDGRDPGLAGRRRPAPITSSTASTS